MLEQSVMCLSMNENQYKVNYKLRSAWWQFINFFLSIASIYGRCQMNINKKQKNLQASK